MLGYAKPLRMSTLEKLLVQIFERKRRIIDQANQQVCSFDNYLRSKLLVDGIAPPPWLRNPEVPSFPSDPEELNKEDLLSEALITQSKHPFPGIFHDLYSQFDVESDGGNCSDVVHGAVHGLNDDYGARCMLPIVPRCSVNKGGCTSSGTHIADLDSISPLHQAEDVTDEDLSLSLARVQRSRSRQRAMELSNSAELTTSSSNENNGNEACPDSSDKSNNEGELEVGPSDGINEGCIVEEVGLTGWPDKKNSFCYTERLPESGSSVQRPNHAVNFLIGNEDGSFSKDAEKHSFSPEQEEIHYNLPSNVETKTLDPDASVQKVKSVASNDKKNSSSDTSEEECQKILIRPDESGNTWNDMLSITEKHLVQSDLAAHGFSYFNNTNGENSSSRHKKVIMQTSCDRLPATLVEDEYDGTKIHIPMEKFNGQCYMAKPVRLVFEESTLDSNVPGLDTSTTVTEFPTLQTHVSVIPDETISNPLVKVSRATDDERRVFCYQNADFSFDKWVMDSKTDCCSNRQWNQKSLVRRSSISNIEVLLYQKKHRTIDAQQANALATSTNLLDNPQDSNSKNLEVSEYYMEGEPEIEDSMNHQQKEGGHIDSSTRLAKQSTCTDSCFVGSTIKFGWEEGKRVSEGKDNHAETLFTFRLNEFKESLFSGLTEQGCRDSQNLILHQIGVVEPVKTVSDVAQNFTINGGQLSSNLKFDHGMESAKYVSSTNRTGKEISSSLSLNARLSCSSPPPLGPQIDIGSISDTMPEFESFLVHPDSFQSWVTEEKISEFELPPYRTVSMHSPVCSLKILGLPALNDIYRSVPSGLLEGMSVESPIHVKDDNCRPHPDSLPNFEIHTPWDWKHPYRSPVRTLWDDITLKYGSSGKRVSSNSELPCINEEIEHADELPESFQKGIGSEVITSSVKREPLADIVNNANPIAFPQEMFSERCSVESVKTNISLSGAQKKIQHKARNQNGCRRKYTSKGKENTSISLGANCPNRTTSLNYRFSRPKLSQETGTRKGRPTFSGTKPPHNDILSNVTSFIPLVQQKQAATAAVKGKRDFNVKALEAAEIKKRLEEKREHERKMKKEALRVLREKAQRERLEQENIKQLELQKKRKEAEQKRKEANMEAKKRQREEVERKGERKRMRFDDTQKQQLEHGEKLCAKKDNQEITYQTTGGKPQGSKDLKGEIDMHKEFDNGQDCGLKENPDIESNTTLASTNDEVIESIVIQDSEDSSESGCSPKVNCNMIRQEDNNLCRKTSEEKSYEISPYKESDDEDEGGDDAPSHKKYVPSWASKQHLSLVVASQQTVIPETIFPPLSFCNITEALMPRQVRLT